MRIQTLRTFRGYICYTYILDKDKNFCLIKGIVYNVKFGVDKNGFAML